MSIGTSVQKFTINRALSYMEKDPVENFPKLVSWAKQFTKGSEYNKTVDKFETYWREQNSYGQLIRRALTEFNPNVRKKLLENFFINSAIEGTPRIRGTSKKIGTNIPWAILMDPTSACNLHCVGCWAAEYEKQDNLSYEKMDEIITQGKDLGIYVYLFSGGEPLVRKKDIIRLCEKHDDCVFIAFTNATLIDEAFVKDLQRVGNFAPAISIEGFEEQTDMRRGKGTYQKIMRAMDLLKDSGIPFGFSTCYHSKNYETVASEEYIDFLIEKGCFFGWYFTYMPLGKDAALELMVDDKQREYMYYRVRDLRDKKPIWLMDFWNDGEFVGGCIAGGRTYFHINARGDCEPCAFIHYATHNINNCTLMEALESPLFRKYQEGQPFNGNMLRPCPLLDNPEALRKIVHESGAVSTQPLDLEDVDELTGKCECAAANWGKTADKLWEQNPHYCFKGCMNFGLDKHIDVK
jgi:MoaA/NifB/PqqE/SkfB family radical SAM enzyme